MRVIDLICPGCGAPVSATGDRKYVFCSYCGRQIYLEETGDFKTSNMNFGEQHRAQHGPNMELAGKLRNARDKLAQREQLERQIEDAQYSLQAANKAKTGSGSVLMGCIAASFFLCFINVGLGVLGLCLGIIIFIIVSKNKKEEKAQVMSEAQQKLNTLYSQKEKHKHDDLGINLNEKYLTSGAMDILYGFVINERAYTLQQAINLFEERAQHLKMEKLARDQLAAQHRQIELLEQQNRQWEERQSEADKDGFSLGKAILIGGLTMDAIRFFRRR